MQNSGVIKSLRQQLNVEYVKPDPTKVDKFIEELNNKQGALDYLKIERGLTDDTIRHFKLGYSAEKDAISIPIFKNGECVNIKYRLLNSKTTKYTQETGAEVWIFNEDGIDKSAKKGGVMISEGEIDCMSIWQSGIKNVVSPASGKDSYGMWIERIDNIPKIYIAYDSDSAGKKSSKAMAERLGNDKCYEIVYPEGVKDANEYFKEHTPEEFRGLIKEARPFYKYLFKGLGDIIQNLRNPENNKSILSTKFIPDVKLRNQFLINVAARTGNGKCLGKGTEILMFDGSIKKVEDIKNGDLLIGPDSLKRNVCGVVNGVDDLYKIIPTKGEPYIVNSAHILSLKKTGTNTIVNISVVDYLKQNKTFKHKHKGWRSPINWRSKPVLIDPYFLGVWLGDGSKDNITINNPEKEIIDYTKEIAHKYGLKIKNSEKRVGFCPRWAITKGENFIGQTHPLLKSFKDYGLLHGKFIPDDYKFNSKDVRLKILAGLLDTDGYLNSNCYEIITKHKRLNDDILFLSRSLGLAAYSSTKIGKIKSINFEGKYHRISISGDINMIPLKIDRKKASKRKQIKNVLHTGIKVESIGVGEYYGFELDSDGLFLLSDFTVTHNTSYVLNIVDDLSKQGESILVLPLENGIDFVGQRLINILTGITDDGFKDVSDDDWSGVIKDVVNRDVYFAMAKMDDIFETILKAKRFFNTKVIIIDLIEELLKESTESEVKAMDRLMYKFKEFCIENDLIIIVVSHIKKDDKQGASIEKPITLSDIRGSGSLINVPHCVVLISKSLENKSMNINVAKNKGKETEKLFGFDVETGRLSLEHDDPNLSEEDNNLWNDK